MFKFPVFCFVLLFVQSRLKVENLAHIFRDDLFDDDDLQAIDPDQCAGPIKVSSVRSGHDNSHTVLCPTLMSAVSR